MRRLYSDLKYLQHAVIDGHPEFLQRLSEKKLQVDEEVFMKPTVSLNNIAGFSSGLIILVVGSRVAKSLS